MPKTGKRYAAARTAVPAGARFAPDEAVKLVKELAFAKFDETVEVATRLGVDPRRADQIVRGTVVLPHGTGKAVRVLVIAQGDKAQEAQDAGADFVGTEYIDKIKEGWLDFDVCVATPDLMGKVGPLGRILGPRGLMPTPKAGTVTLDVERAVQEIKAGKIEFRVGAASARHHVASRQPWEGHETARMPCQRLGKRYAAARAAVPAGTRFAPDEAVKLVKELAFAKFDETVEVATRLGVDPRKADQIVRGTVVLPHGTGKAVRVLVIAQGDKAQEAAGRRRRLRGYGVHRQDQGGLARFRRLRRDAGPDGQGRTAGPDSRPAWPHADAQGRDRDARRRAAPSRRSRPVRSSSASTRPGTCTRPSERSPSPRSSSPRTSRPSWTRSCARKPSGAKGTYVKSVTVSSTMGPGVSIDPNLYRRA